MNHLISISLALVILTACNKPKTQAHEPRPASQAPASEEAKPSPEAPVPGEAPPSDTRPVAATVSTHTFDCSALNVGLYWFGKGDLAQKSSLATRNTFFHPMKPTVIYVHGWQAGSHSLEKRGTFNYSKYDPIYGLKVDAADAWIDAGWNIGIFYWNQIGDELSPNTAEDKVWGTRSITWKDCKGKDLPVEGSPESVVELFHKSYIEALKDYRGSHIRIAGHSLGNQLATKLADRVTIEAAAGKMPSSLIPKRVALLDPWWSAATRNQNRAAGLKTTIESLKSKGMIFEWYKTSAMTDNLRSDDNAALIPVIGQVELAPDYYSTRNQLARHTAAPYLYFLSFKDPPPKGCALPCTEAAPSAATPDARMLDLMNKALQWQHVGGRETADTADNTFEIKGK